MKRNGFTLLELLTVIVILAIILLIVTPIIVNTSQKKDVAYSKIVCNFDGNAIEYNIDEVLSLNETTAVIKNGSKIYEFQRNNCYLIADELGLKK